MQSHICRVHACLAVACHLHSWQICVSIPTMQVQLQHHTCIYNQLQFHVYALNCDNTCLFSNFHSIQSLYKPSTVTPHIHFHQLSFSLHTINCDTIHAFVSSFHSFSVPTYHSAGCLTISTTLSEFRILQICSFNNIFTY